MKWEMQTNQTLGWSIQIHFNDFFESRSMSVTQKHIMCVCQLSAAGDNFLFLKNWFRFSSLILNMAYVEITKYLVIRLNVTVIAWHYLDECAECRIWHHTNTSDYFSKKYIPTIWLIRLKSRYKAHMSSILSREKFPNCWKRMSLIAILPVK